MTIIQGQRVVCLDGERPASLHIQDGVIVGIGPYEAARVGAGVVDAGSLVVSPGVVDSHVHINEPGRTEWEGFDTATRAAAAGGVTTLVDMPLNSIPPTTSVDGLRAKRAAAQGRCQVDVGFWGGLVPANAGEPDVLTALVDAGVRGFKCFLVPSGVDEFPSIDEAGLRRAMPVLARLNVPLLVHAEWPDRLRPSSGDLGSYRTYLATRPPEAEVVAVELMIRLAAEFGTRTHIVHVSAARTVDILERARRAGVPISGETCPHYLTFTADDVPDGATVFKCAPPIRDTADREALWTGLRGGALQMVVTDHSPAPAAVKGGDFARAWGGIASLELSLPAVWTAARARGFSIADMAALMSANPAALAGLAGCKGSLAVGCDADVTIWDPDASFEVEAERMYQRHKITPYAGTTLSGRVHATFVRGERVWDGQGFAATPRGGLV